MKTGFNMLLWTGHATAEHTAILKGIKKAGYDTVEIPVFEGTPDYFARLGEQLDKIGLERSIVSVIGPSGKNPLSPDKAARAAAVDYTKWVIDCTHALGARMIVGPMHSEIGYFTGDGATAAETKRGISFHRKVGDYAARRDIRFALEAINRFECYFLKPCSSLRTISTRSTIRRSRACMTPSMPISRRRIRWPRSRQSGST
jgi:D-psicose/D-tagatose/L-ribulose 3-epimerase